MNIKELIGLTAGDSLLFKQIVLSLSIVSKRFILNKGGF